MPSSNRCDILALIDFVGKYMVKGPPWCSTALCAGHLLHKWMTDNSFDTKQDGCPVEVLRVLHRYFVELVYFQSVSRYGRGRC